MTPAECSVEGCSNKERRRGMCRKHCAVDSSGRQCEKCGVGIREGRALCLPCYESTRKSRLEVWDFAARATEYRIRLKAAEAKVRQAILVLEHPETAFPTTVNECLSVALEELEVSDVA